MAVFPIVNEALRGEDRPSPDRATESPCRVARQAFGAHGVELGRHDGREKARLEATGRQSRTRPVRELA